GDGVRSEHGSMSHRRACCRAEAFTDGGYQLNRTRRQRRGLFALGVIATMGFFIQPPIPGKDGSAHSQQHQQTIASDEGAERTKGTSMGPGAKEIALALEGLEPGLATLASWSS